MSAKNLYETRLKHLNMSFSNKWEGVSERTRLKYVAREYALFALGDALANSKGWSLTGMDAIEYAVILKFSWPVEDVRSLPLRDKWLVLHDELSSLGFPVDAQMVWDNAHGATQAWASFEIWEEHLE